MNTITKMTAILALSLSLTASAFAAGNMTPEQKEVLVKDHRAVKAQKQLVIQDRAKLNSDVTAYGKHSEQARTDRGQLRKDRKLLQQARQQAYNDRKQQS